MPGKLPIFQFGFFIGDNSFSHLSLSLKKLFGFYIKKLTERAAPKNSKFGLHIILLSMFFADLVNQDRLYQRSVKFEIVILVLILR